MPYPSPTALLLFQDGTKRYIALPHLAPILEMPIERSCGSGIETIRFNLTQLLPNYTPVYTQRGMRPKAIKRRLQAQESLF